MNDDVEKLKQEFEIAEKLLRDYRWLVRQQEMIVKRLKRELKEVSD